MSSERRSFPSVWDSLSLTNTSVHVCHERSVDPRPPYRRTRSLTTFCLSCTRAFNGTDCLCLVIKSTGRKCTSGISGGVRTVVTGICSSPLWWYCEMNTSWISLLCTETVQTPWLKKGSWDWILRTQTPERHKRAYFSGE